MASQNARELSSERIADAQLHVCKHCERDPEMKTLPCPECPCPWCGGEVDRSKTLHKKFCCPECKKEFEKYERRKAFKMYRKSKRVMPAKDDKDIAC